MAPSAVHLETYRRELTGHCYRMLGSATDADDAVQDTMLRAWRGLDQFDGRASLKTWLYRIATNVCLDALTDRKRRARPFEEGPAGSTRDPLIRLDDHHWIEPIADARALPLDAHPGELAILRESIRLAFVTALQHLPPRQRAVLLLVEVLGWSATEVAETLDMSVPAVNSALQRARATLSTLRKDPEPAALSRPQTELLQRYVDAFQRYDVDALASLLCQDAAFSMPPYALWLQGRDAVRDWLSGRGAGCRGSRLVPTSACASPAFGQYRPDPEGGHRPWGLVVLELSDDGISAWNTFLDTDRLFPMFNLPPRLEA